LHYADEVTRPFAEDYARWLFPRVTTADKHIGCLRREWQLLFPDAPANPWNLSIRLQKKEKARAMNYRALTLNEIRRVRQAIARLRLNKSPLGSRGHLLDDALLADMADALVFSYHYGLRIGSVGVIRWDDFNLADKTWSHRPPKTSRATLGNDYPILPEIEAILARRRAAAGNHPLGLLFPAFARTHSAAEQLFNLSIKAIFKLARVLDSPLKGRASWHSFRATFITRLTENGCPQAIVKELAQHVRADVTQRYVHISMAAKDKWLLTLPDLGDIDLSAEYPTEPELIVPQ
jgi:integrase